MTESIVTPSIGVRGADGSGRQRAIAAPARSRVAAVPAFYGRRRKRGSEICQILIKNGDVAPEDVRAALRQQEESGGQIGQILIHMGALSREALSRALLEQLQERRAQAT